MKIPADIDQDKIATFVVGLAIAHLAALITPAVVSVPGLMLTEGQAKIAVDHAARLLDLAMKEARAGFAAEETGVPE